MTLPQSPLLWPVAYTTACTSVQAVIGIFYKLRSKLEYVWLRNIYYAFVHPYLYGIEIYANTCTTY